MAFQASTVRANELSCKRRGPLFDDNPLRGLDRQNLNQAVNGRADDRAHYGPRTNGTDSDTEQPQADSGHIGMSEDRPTQTLTEVQKRNRKLTRGEIEHLPILQDHDLSRGGSVGYGVDQPYIRLAHPQLNEPKHVAGQHPEPTTSSFSSCAA